jgi:hypothetical protein
MAIMADELSMKGHTPTLLGVEREVPGDLIRRIRLEPEDATPVDAVRHSSIMPERNGARSQLSHFVGRTE